MARKWPSGTEYAEAIQQPSTAFPSVDYLSEATLTTTMLGLPAMASGQNAVAFHMEADGNPVAVRCFLGEQSDGQARYAAMAEHLLVRRIPAVVPAEWIDDGIRVNGQAWPVVVMPWVDGVPLHDAIEERLDADSASLERLADRWLDLVEALQVEGFTHGDLQHGNVLLDADDSFRLVDLDGVWVASMPVGAPDEYGHPNYQHAARSRHDWGATTDTFSALSIGVSMVALAERPDLRRFMTGENLLFTANDYRDPDGAAVWAELDQLSSPETLAMSTRLRNYCRMSAPPTESLTVALDPERVTAARTGTPAEHEPAPASDTGLPVGGLADGDVPWWQASAAAAATPDSVALAGAGASVNAQPTTQPEPVAARPTVVAPQPVAASRRTRAFAEVGLVAAGAGFLGSLIAGLIQRAIDDANLDAAIFVLVVSILVCAVVHSWPAFRQRAASKGIVDFAVGAVAGAVAAGISLAIADPIVESAVGFEATEQAGLVVYVWALAGALIGFAVGVLRSPLAAAAALALGAVGGAIGGFVFGLSNSLFIARGLVVDGLEIPTALAAALVAAVVALAVQLGTRSARSGLLEVVDGPGSGAVIEAHRGRATIGGSTRDTIRAAGAVPAAVTISFGDDQIVATTNTPVRLDGELVEGTFAVRERQVLGVNDLFVRVESKGAS